MQIDDSYYTILAQIESGGNPNAKNPYSSGSGLYQFLKDTWTGLGYAWKDVFNVDLQNQAIRKLTERNANVLSKAGVTINNETLYAAHFLGAGGASEVLSSSPDTKLSDVLSNWSGIANANGFSYNMTVSGFADWLKKKLARR